LDYAASLSANFNNVTNSRHMPDLKLGASGIAMNELIGYTLTIAIYKNLSHIAL